MGPLSAHAAQRPVTVMFAVTQHLELRPVTLIFQTPVDLCRPANEPCYVMICMSPTGYKGPTLIAGFLARSL